MSRNFSVIFVSLFLIFFNCECYCAVNKNKVKKNIIPIQTGLVVDAKTGKVLYSKNPRIKIHPASLTKWMTLYLVFEAVESGKLNLDRKIYISENAASKPPCKMGLPPGDYITVRAAISSLIVGSHNDIAVALAEAIAGSEQKFALRMTQKAKQIGMKNSVFKTASGLHHNEQLTTALDLVKLSLAIKRNYPRFYPLLSETQFVYRERVYNGHNQVMKTYKYAKASKTGFTSPSGYNLITHASKANKDIIAVVTGYKSANTRNRQMVVLLDKHLGVRSSATIASSSNKNKNIKLAANINKTKRKPVKKRNI